MKSSPWGAVQQNSPICPGMTQVSTAGHGGIMVTKTFAAANLSAAARKRGMKYSDYLCYEEDCDFAIPIFELPELWPIYFQHATNITDRKQYLLESLSGWNADYLLERGLEPDPKCYAFYKERVEPRKHLTAHCDPAL